jgi:hypothetical protein
MKFKAGGLIQRPVNVSQCSCLRSFIAVAVMASLHKPALGQYFYQLFDSYMISLVLCVC